MVIGKLLLFLKAFNAYDEIFYVVIANYRRKRYVPICY